MSRHFLSLLFSSLQLYSILLLVNFQTQLNFTFFPNGQLPPPTLASLPCLFSTANLKSKGGGYRACLGFLAAIEALQNEGLWDNLTYIAGVSGSCWSLGALFTFGSLHAGYLLDHFATTSAHHPLSAAAVNAVARSAHGIYFQLAPILQKMRIGHLHPGPLDLYSTLITSHIFLSPPARQGSLPAPKDQILTDQEAEQRYQDAQKAHMSGQGRDRRKDKAEATLKREWFQWSRVDERMEISVGKQPLPILTAVRHERPWKDWKSKEEPFGDEDHSSKEHSK